MNLPPKYISDIFAFISILTTTAKAGPWPSQFYSCAIWWSGLHIYEHAHTSNHSLLSNQSGFTKPWTWFSYCAPAQRLHWHLSTYPVFSVHLPTCFDIVLIPCTFSSSLSGSQLIQYMLNDNFNKCLSSSVIVKPNHLI